MPVVMSRARRRPPARLGAWWAAALQGAGAALVKRVTVRSQLAPPITFEPFAETPPDAKPNWFLRLAKPHVTLETASGPIVVAPAGEPTAQYGVPAAAAVGVLALVGLGATVRWLWHLRRRSP